MSFSLSIHDLQSLNRFTIGHFSSLQALGGSIDIESGGQETDTEKGGKRAR
jgi:hypothetical protein